jgi:ATP-binding cassette, subfamily B, bacterial PglK
MFYKLKQLWRYLSKRRQKQFWALILLMLVTSLAEIISLGAVVPFLGILSAPEQVFQHSYMQPIVNYFTLTDSSQLILPLTIMFSLSAILAGLVRILLLYVMTRLSYAAGADLSINIYRRTLYKKYEQHIESNSSEVINGIITKTNTVIGGVLLPILNLISSFVLFISILATLLFINTLLALLAVIGFGTLYWLIILYTRKRLKINSKIIANQSTDMIQALQEGLGGIRDVLIDGTQEFYCRIYRKADLQLRKASGDNVFIIGSPRFVMESLGMTLIAVLAYVIHQEGSNFIPLMGALALGAQRLLPVLQNMYASYTVINGASASLADVFDLLKHPLPVYLNQPLSEMIPFENKIKLQGLSYRYKAKTPYIFESINLTIKKGSRVGFIGQTGCGKSTLLDVIMGLLLPIKGEIVVDSKVITENNCRQWQAHISHVPQTIYLSDSTIEENIAFGIPKKNIDHVKVVKAARLAKIDEIIESWDDQYQTIVGERGVRLSGGQRQRIGIARALYKKTDVLIFDEATSALDSRTEESVMKNIKDLGNEITILIIAHRLSTLKGCDQIFELTKDGALIRQLDEIL